ncbi:DNA-3-methyladenine glycosylase I [Spirillospora sp. NPDC052269]
MNTAVIGEDGLARCPWGLSAPEYVAYHDEEWGRPIRDDQGLYERLCLETFQSGLSWLTILRKREGFRAAFAGFDMEKVAAFDEHDVERLMADAGIVRNRMKIDATINNARAALELKDGLAEIIWRYADPGAAVPETMDDVPPSTPGSKALSKELKKNGFRFVGPTTAYALMEACGLVDDHLAACHRRGAYS